MFALLPLLLLVTATRAQTLQNITIFIVNQTNAPTYYPNFSNKVMCQNITDSYGYPLILGADDMVPPSRASWATQYGALSCHAMLLSFETVRTRQDLNPSNITVWLMRDDPGRGGPGTVFYARTLPWPTNNYRWRDDPISMPFDTELLLSQGDVADDGATVFDLASEAFLPGDGQRTWVALYVTMSLHMIQAGFRRNAFYWTILNGAAAAGAGGHFFYRDVRNKEKLGFVNWTDGAIVAAPLGIVSSTYQMAWRASLQCRGTPPPPTVAPTLAPLGVAPSAPSTVPSAGGDGDNGTTSPSSLTNNSDSDSNSTLFSERMRVSMGVGLSIGLCALVCMTGCVAVLVWRYVKRRRHRDLRATSLNRILVSEQQQQQPVFDGNPLYPQYKPGDSVRIFTAGGEARPINYSTAPTVTDYQDPVRRLYTDLLNNHVDTTDEDG